jgi:hypothetical protein
MCRGHLLLACLFLLVCAASLSGSAVHDIHSIDFRNFDYPEIPGETNTHIRLVNGHRDIAFGKDGPIDEPHNVEAGLESVHYGYWGTDENEVAAVVLWVSGGGTGVWQEIFIYSNTNNKPSLLWSFEGGDRASGGVRAVYFERSNLVVEVYEEWQGDPLCCASHYTRRFFERSGKKTLELTPQRGLPVPNR